MGVAASFALRPQEERPGDVPGCGGRPRPSPTRKLGHGMCGAELGTAPHVPSRAILPVRYREEL